MMARGSVVKTITPSASLEEKIAFVLQRDQEAQSDMNEVRHKLEDLENELSKRFDALRAQLTEHFTAELAAEIERHRPLRVAGAVALAVGLACTIFANFV